MKSLRTFGVVLAGLLIAGLALPQAAAAKPIIVGDGTAASCTENALRNAIFAAGIDGGGTIRFRCGPAPVTISLTAVSVEEPALTLPNNTIINGGGLVTLESPRLDGSVALSVQRSSIVRLKNLTLVGHDVSQTVSNSGTLSIQNTSVSDKQDCGYNCPRNGTSAIFSDGTLIVQKQLVFPNRHF